MYLMSAEDFNNEQEIIATLTYEKNCPIDNVVLVNDFLLSFTKFTLNNNKTVLLAHPHKNF